MGQIYLTCQVRGLDGVIAQQRAATVRQKQRILGVMERSGERAREDVEDHCPVDEGLMIAALRLTPTREGYHYSLGWLASDIVGKRRPKSKTIVTFFYPRAVIRGTRRRAGNNILLAAELRERPRRRKELRRALEG